MSTNSKQDSQNSNSGFDNFKKVAFNKNTIVAISAAVVVLVVALILVIGSILYSTGRAQLRYSRANAFEKEVLRLTNLERENYDLPPLEWNNILGGAARFHSRDMYRTTTL